MVRCIVAKCPKNGDVAVQRLQLFCEGTVLEAGRVTHGIQAQSDRHPGSCSPSAIPSRRLSLAAAAFYGMIP